MNQPMLKEEARPDEVPPSTPEGGLPSGLQPSADAAGQSPQAVVQPGAADAPSGLGPALMQLRETRGMSRGEVSGRLKFSVRQVEALETEQWGRLPTGMSLRGFVKNYARLLDTDAQPFLQLLERQTGVVTPREAAVVHSASLSSDVPLHGESASRPWGWLFIILILLFVAGFYAIERGWIPDSWLVFDWLKSLKND